MGSLRGDGGDFCCLFLLTWARSEHSHPRGERRRVPQWGHQLEHRLIDYEGVTPGAKGSPLLALGELIQLVPLSVLNPSRGSRTILARASLRGTWEALPDKDRREGALIMGLWGLSPFM